MENEVKKSIIAEIKERRLLIDNLMQRMEGLNGIDSMQQAFYKIREAKAWSGELLKILDSPNPYPASTDVKSPTIEVRTELANPKTDDSFISDIFKDADRDEFEDQITIIGEVKATRLILDKLLKGWDNLTSVVNSHVTLDSTECELDTVGLLFIRIETVVDKLTECKHWCGWALNDIREGKH